MIVLQLLYIVYTCKFIHVVQVGLTICEHLYYDIITNIRHPCKFVHVVQAGLTICERLYYDIITAITH